MSEQTETDERILCDYCGENPADQKHTYLLPGARINPDSAAFGRDDCSWCSDHEAFSCQPCRSRMRTRHPDVEGYGKCSTFFFERMPHLFRAGER